MFFFIYIHFIFHLFYRMPRREEYDYQGSYAGEDDNDQTIGFERQQMAQETQVSVLPSHVGRETVQTRRPNLEQLIPTNLNNRQKIKLKRPCISTNNECIPH